MNEKDVQEGKLNATGEVQEDANNFNALQYLQLFREYTLGMKRVGNRYAVNLSDSFTNVEKSYWLTSEEDDLADCLHARLWIGDVTKQGVAGDCLAELTFAITLKDNRPLVRTDGAFCGNFPQDVYAGIDFSSKELQALLGELEKEGGLLEFRHDASRIWWTEKDFLDEYIDEGQHWSALLKEDNAWAGDFRSFIIMRAEELVKLLPFRIVKSPDAIAQKQKQDGEKYLQTALDYDFGQNGKQKNAKEAVKYYIKCLEIMESGLAYFNLALSYLKGDGVEVDKRHGYKLMWKAHHAGFPKASFYLASCFEKGKDCTVDVVQAAKLYRAASQKGHLEATFKLGLLTKEGNGVDKNPSEAFRLFGIAAKSDEKSVKPEWLYEYAHCFFIGLGTAKNPAAGIDMMRRAAEAGNADAQYAMANAYAFGHGVPKNESEHKQWLAKAASNGNMFAQFERGEDLAEAAPQLAIKFFQRAASQGHVLAQVRLQELETEVENAKVESLVKQAEQGNRHAQFELGMRYLQGKGVTQNSRRGFDWLSEAAEHGNMDALAELGWCYLEGVGVSRPNSRRAFACFEKAAGPIKKSKNRRALRGLLHCYRQGIGTERDRSVASDIELQLNYLSLFPPDIL